MFLWLSQNCPDAVFILSGNRDGLTADRNKIRRDAFGAGHIDQEGTVDAEEFGAKEVLPLADTGPVGMIIITLLFIGLFFAAWKAPAWVKEIGIAALVVGAFWTILGFLQAADFIQGHGDISPNIIWGGVKVGLISILYGLIVYFVSLVIRVTRKPRI